MCSEKTEGIIMNINLFPEKLEKLFQSTDRLYFTNKEPSFRGFYKKDGSENDFLGKKKSAEK